MISPAYVVTMAKYNAEMNCRVYAAAARLPDAERRTDAGAFWGSIHGTLSHLVWGDRMWMSRFDGWEQPDRPLKESATLYDDFDTMATARSAIDAKMVDWSRGVDEAWLAGDLVWFSGATRSERHAPRALLVAHMFNHQTHHRGQVHALLTRQGEDTGDTDLMLLAAT